MYFINNEPNTVQNTKTTDIIANVRQLLVNQNIIDKYGNILNISLYCQAIESEKSKRLKALEKIPVINNRIIDDKNASVLFDELNFLTNVGTHRRNYNYALEYPKPRIAKPVDRTVWQRVDRMRRKMLVVFRKRFR